MSRKKVHDLVGLAVQNVSATKVTQDLDLEVGTCNMNDGDKIGTSDIGTFVQSVRGERYS